jgi:hypothetical protein
MKTAQQIADSFGGQSALASLIGKRQSTVSYWCKTGNVPKKWQSQLIQLAQESGIDLTPQDFLTIVDPPKLPSSHSKRIPEAKHYGILPIGEAELPCYVLDDGRRVLSRTGAASVLTDKASGDLESYLRAQKLQSYIPSDFQSQLIEFSIKEMPHKKVQGIQAETFLEICQAYIKARDAGEKLTAAQTAMAIKSGMFLSACAKVGLIALIDEATGYQYDRPEDALMFKLKAYLADEMRKWEKTFPDELWKEFGRLTNWQGAVTQRPKYWGKLVMELVYEYLDSDVADWLKKNAPKPRSGQNYHQWLNAQYGLKKLVEHIWMLVGMARACHTMRELREKMAEQYGRRPVQFTLFLPPSPPKPKVFKDSNEVAKLVANDIQMDL